MVVLTVTNCPQKLRGDLTKWFLEINTGVYVGNVNARVREALWKRICDNVCNGQATMVFSTNNEQHMDFYVHNTVWKPIDLEGLKLIKHPHTNIEKPLELGFSNIAKQRLGKRRKRKKEIENSFAIIDIETTGLSEKTDEILELGALIIENGVCIKEYEKLIKTQNGIPKEITQLTGISEDQVQDKGVTIKTALPEYLKLLEGYFVMGYNVDFDCKFLKKACERYGIVFYDFKKKDILSIVKETIKRTDSYKLSEVAKVLGIETEQKHRALSDCKLLYQVICKLNENVI